MDKIKAIIAGLIALIVALAAAFAYTYFGLGAYEAERKANLEKQQLLFVQTADSGSFVKGDGDAYTLILNNVSPKTIYFTDRPHRMAGIEDTGNFVNYWSQGDDSFKQDPPNAALELIDAAENADVIAVELSDPVYDSEAKTLQYKVIILPETGSESLSNFDKRQDDFIPETFGETSLFIDAAAGFPTAYCNWVCPPG